MIIAGHRVDPATVTHLTITHAGGTLTVDGPAAVAALQAIRRVRPRKSTGRPPGPAPRAEGAILTALAAGGPLTMSQIVTGSGVSASRVSVIVARLISDGRVVSTPGVSGRGSAYMLASHDS